MNAGELIQYTTAESMAAAYTESTAKIRRLIVELGEESEKLQVAFASDNYSGHHFGIGLEYAGQSRLGCDADSAETIIGKMKLAAWAAIIAKLNIRRLMSSKRIEQLDAALEIGSGRNYRRQACGRDVEELTEFPDITPEDIASVANGMAMSATEFLEEAVAEEYDYWRPRMDSEYKTNANGFYKLQRKVIKGWMVERGYGGGGKFRCRCSSQAHITALDSIFHMLAGLGPVKEYKGPLASAIETSGSGTGETDFFRFKCFKNGNLHLEFKRQDLLDLFNQIAAKGDRLGQERRAG